MLSNLRIIENIALIDSTHQKTSNKQALKNALKTLEALDLSALADKRISQCTELELIAIQLARAYHSYCTRVLLLFPLNMNSYTPDLNILISYIEILNATSINQSITPQKSTYLVDLKHTINHYQEIPCLTNA
jgi:ABC-type arginine transport system ATPase subunit